MKGYYKCKCGEEFPIKDLEKHIKNFHFEVQ